ncbi:LysM peptidoglycan-binding domain-containing protein [Bacillus sp. BHET2]|uniref:LysM peptidoglycan-binding domain-containing protein n=1 Tax=Bacillus sp. BHET2 TaxID=2583818 RepID=UPI00110F3CFE|nr:LysM peptidoglycan-binding domain-containing protein [Bacillus sp. BHET2]TMU86720.1 LysM peptidoglycan-binding domain-containing protein [Bacillus sp. BHET2]
MSKDPYRDQAAKLKKKIERVKEEVPVRKREPLPPRSELHREKQKKNKWKMKYPLISMLLLFFILLPLTVFSIYSYFDHRNGPLIVLSDDVDDVVEVRYDHSESEESEEMADSKEEEEPPSNTQKEEERKEPVSNNNGKNQQAPANPPVKEEEVVKEEPKQEKEKEQPNYKIVSHTVKPQETLYRIAMNYYHSPSGVDRIKEWNKIQDNEIQTGQVLEIPLDQ